MTGRDQVSHGAPVADGASPPDRLAPARRLDAPPSKDVPRRERTRRLAAVMAALERARALHHGRG